MEMSKLEEVIEQFCPKSFAVDWDNVGLLAGRSDKEVNRVLLALDATSAVIDEAINLHADALITHHPLLFHGAKQINDGDYVGKRIVKLLRNDIAYYAMHTNFDVMGMADAAADALKLQNRDVLEVTYHDEISKEGIGRIGNLPEFTTLRDLALEVKEAFDIPHVRYYGDPDATIVTAAILPGSGKDDIDTAVDAGADVFITGDITHHVGIDAVEKGIAVIDGGHFGIEKLFLPYMKDFLAREAPELTVLLSTQGEPFEEV